MCIRGSVPADLFRIVVLGAAMSNLAVTIVQAATRVAPPIMTYRGSAATIRQPRVVSPNRGAPNQIVVPNRTVIPNRTAAPLQFGVATRPVVPRQIVVPRSAPPVIPRVGERIAPPVVPPAIGAAQLAKGVGPHIEKRRPIARQVLIHGRWLVLPAVVYVGAAVFLDVPDLGQVAVPEDEYPTIFDLLASDDPSKIEAAYPLLQPYSVPGLDPVAAAGAGATEPAPSLWDFNGSVMNGSVDGEALTLLYRNPRPAMREAGVTEGALFFSGTRTGEQQLDGTAYVFSLKCGALPYQMAGWGNAAMILLTGEEPNFDDRCHVVSVNSVVAKMTKIQPSENK